MNILVLGASGMAGHIIALYLQELGCKVTVLSRREFPYCESIICDVFDQAYLKKIILDNRYDVIINCIGILNQEAEINIDKAIYLNSFLPHFLVTVTKEIPTKIIHLSTDCVFSGTKGNYTESDYKDGTSDYAITKSLGEIIDEKNLTIRTSIIGPDMNENGIGLLNWFMKQNKTINGYHNVIWTGVTTLVLAKAIFEAINQKINGLYNLVNNNTIRKLDLLELFNKNFRESKITILKDETIKSDKSLICTREDFKFQVPTYEEMIIELKEWIQTHKELYPNYYWK
jgi:dTDP-4-dehydrorhamnose reductase